ncbi:MAG: S9 family peptidase [Candidatus Aminicenantes bacterium]|nr:S9 family peptidase [Candidatus Aminicenantes bacterium]
MKKKITQSRLLRLILLFFFLQSSLPLAVDDPESIENQKQDYTISSWLVLGPHCFPYPAFSDVEKNGMRLKALLLFEEVDIAFLQPVESGILTWHAGNTDEWKKISAEEGNINLPVAQELPASAYLAAYIDVDRWTQGTFSVQSPQVYQVFLDGRSVLIKDKIDENSGSSTAQSNKKTTTIALETGKHLIIIKTLNDPDLNSKWTIQATLTVENRYNNLPPEFSLTPIRNMNIADLLDSPQIAAVSISADGVSAAVSLRRSIPPSDENESWIEFYQVSDGTLMQTLRGNLSIDQINWAPAGRKFSYTSRNETGSTLWIVDMDSGTNLPLLKNIKNMGSHVWSPTGSSIFYYVREEGKKDLPGVKRIQTMEDRQPYGRDRNYLYQVSVPGGISIRLTAGELTTNLNSISPDGTRILFTRTLPEYGVRPYSKTQLFILDIDTLSPKLLWEGSFLRSAQWNPKGDKLLITGGPSTFGKIGIDLKKNLIPNDYDNQAYLLDLATEEITPLSLNFDPSIEETFWNKTDGHIYLIAVNRSYRQLYRYDWENKKYTLIRAGVEYIDNLVIAEKTSAAIYSGSSANIPQKAYVLDLKSLKYRELTNPAKNDFAYVRFGDVKRWTFKNNQGLEIEGRVYYPPDFDPNKKYPCIVYYYGGTTPVTREFGGRYPKNLYAAQGYIVYVLQPSGSIGFGQDFSALHVNDWGAIVTEDIIKGVKEFLADHPFVDPQRIGCMGASYGGFMTMLLLTRTNLFTAAISHAGISSIASYWGEGYWGYSYSAVAAANSFPWSRKDIFINQSPLFNADEITTPLLLLHGSSDTNVPPGESTQIFTALKLLGREVEYIQFADQNHHILTYGKRILWTKTIMAWFDYWLKSEPEWWSSLYPNK